MIRWLATPLHRIRHSPLSRLWDLFKTLAAIAVLAVAAVVGVPLLADGPIDDGPPVGTPAPTTTSSADRDAGAGETTGAASDRSTRSTAPPSRATGESPWESETVVVGVRNRAAPSRNVTAAVAAALDYWEEHEGYGTYPVDFVLEPDADRPDIIVWYNETVDCPTGAAGCAPRLNGTVEARSPEHVQIRHEESDNYRTVRNTITHEFGHVLGIGHCEEPHWIMSYRVASRGCANPTVDGPNVTERDLAWRDSNLSVYVDYSGVSETELADTRSQIDHALAYFEEGRAERFPADVSFTRVEDRWRADVVITVGKEAECRGDSPACIYRWGRDYDGDGAYEYYTRATVAISPDVDTEARGWFVGWGLAHHLAPGHVPPVFEDAGYRERRSEWWD